MNDRSSVFVVMYWASPDAKEDPQTKILGVFSTRDRAQRFINDTQSEAWIEVASFDA